MLEYVLLITHDHDGWMTVQTWRHEQHMSCEAFGLGSVQTFGRFQLQYLEEVT